MTDSINITSLYVEITNQCNLDCKSCYNRSGQNHGCKEISAQQLAHILRLFLPYGLKRLLLSGGEPTLHTEFDRILDLVDEYPTITFGIVTNGTNPSSRLIDYVNTRANLTLQISLDGSCEEQNARTRGNGNFEKVLALAEQIHRDSPAHLLKMVVSQRNFSDVESFCRLALRLGFTPELSFLFPSGNGANDWDKQKLTAQQKLALLNQIKAFNQEYHTEAFLPLCTSICPYAKSLHDLSLCIKTDGSIQPCQMLYDSAFTLGNVFDFNEESFVRKLRELSDLARERSLRDYGCSRCLLKIYCGRGCMAEAFLLHRDPLSCDDACEYRKLQFLPISVHPI